jgi:DNA polymerase-3 subunit epsilon
MKILWMDTETTGLDVEDHGIWQIAFIVDIDGKMVDKKVFLMNPADRDIAEEALKVNQMTVEQIRSFPDWLDVYPAVYSFLKKYVDPFDKSDKFIVAGQNVKFDVDFLLNFWKECGDDFLFSFIKSGAYIDTLYISTFLQWAGKLKMSGSRNLETLAGLLGIDFDSLDLHDALVDIELTREVGIRMLEMLNEGSGTA